MNIFVVLLPILLLCTLRACGRIGIHQHKSGEFFFIWKHPFMLYLRTIER